MRDHGLGILANAKLNNKWLQFKHVIKSQMPLYPIIIIQGTIMKGNVFYRGIFIIFFCFYTFLVGSQYLEIKKMKALIVGEVYEKLKVISEKKSDQLDIYLNTIDRKAKRFLANKHIVNSFVNVIKNKEQPYDNHNEQYLKNLVMPSIDNYGFSNIFLINNHGDVVFNVHNELNGIENLNSTNYKLLKDLYLSVQNSKMVETKFSDFFYFTPAKEFTSFVAMPIIQNNATVGVLMCQLSIAKISSIMNKWAQLGLEFSEKSYLINNNLSTLYTASNSSLKVPLIIQEYHLNVAMKYDGDILKDEIKENTSFINNKGIKILTSYSSFMFKDSNWFVFSVIEEERTLIGLEKLNIRTYFLFIITICLFIVALLIFLIFRSYSITKLDNK